MPLMALIRPPAINLSLKCQHAKFSSQMSTWVNYVAFVKNIWIRDEVIVHAKRSTELRSPSGVTLALAKRNKDVSEENAPLATGEDQSNRLSRREKFAVRVIMLVDIAPYNVLNEILLLVEFIFRGGKMCKFSTLCDRLFSLSVFLLKLLSLL